ARELEAFAAADAVDPDGERARGGDARVLLSQRAGRRIARGRGQLLGRVREPFVQLPEARDRQVDLAAYLEERRDVVTLHPQRHTADSTEIDGYVLALDPVA